MAETIRALNSASSPITLKAPNEEVGDFTKSVGRTAVEGQPDDNGPDSREWDFGYIHWGVGSLHTDTLTVATSDVARRGGLAVYEVYPVGGLWKENRNVDSERCMFRFSSVVEIDTTEVNVGLYAEVQQEVALQVEIQV